MPRIMTIWFPRWPVQRRLVEQPDRRFVPLLVCRREGRGVMRVVSWAWARPSIVGRPSRSEAGKYSVATQLPSRRGRGVEGSLGPAIPAGMSLAETLAAISLAYGSRAGRIAEVDHDDPQADREGLEVIGRWCRRFAPIVAIEDSDRPECLHIDVTDTAVLFGGEDSVARTAVWTLASKGLYARAGVADTPAAAWVAARRSPAAACRAARRVDEEAGRSGSGSSAASDSFLAGSRGMERLRRWRVVTPGRQSVELAAFPIASLRVPPEDIARLSDIGVTTIGGLMRLPIAGLASRFSPNLPRRLSQFKGTLAEPLEGICGEDLPSADCRLESPCTTLEAIRHSLESLVSACVTSLAAHGQGVTVLQVRLEPSGSGPPTVVDVGLFRPSCSVRHLSELVELRLSRVRLPREVDGLAVEVIAAAAVDFHQRTLFTVPVDVGGDAVTEAMLERLSGRLGRSAVFEPQTVADPQPEHAWVATPVLNGCFSVSRRPFRRPAVATTTIPSARETTGSRRSFRPEAARFRSGERPIWLLPQPIRLEMVSVIPDGPPVRFRFHPGHRPRERPRWAVAEEPQRIVRFWGPERIETAWWRGGTVRRDYYVVELETGGRLWIFRSLRDGEWFLHGRFA